MGMVQQPMEFTRNEALAVLKRSDHVWLKPEAAVGIQIAFGMKPYLQRQRANTGDPKGLYVEGAGRNAMVEGFDAAMLARDVATHLGAHVPTKWGRGSQLWAAIEEIEKKMKDV